MSAELHVTLTGIVGDLLWGVDQNTGNAVVWDQRIVRFRLPTQEEIIGARMHAERIKAQEGKGSPQAGVARDARARP